MADEWSSYYVSLKIESSIDYVSIHVFKIDLIE